MSGPSGSRNKRRPNSKNNNTPTKRRRTRNTSTLTNLSDLPFSLVLHHLNSRNQGSTRQVSTNLRNQYNRVVRSKIRVFGPYVERLIHCAGFKYKHERPTTVKQANAAIMRGFRLCMERNASNSRWQRVFSFMKNPRVWLEGWELDNGRLFYTSATPTPNVENRLPTNYQLSASNTGTSSNSNTEHDLLSYSIELISENISWPENSIMITFRVHRDGVIIPKTLYVAETIYSVKSNVNATNFTYSRDIDMRLV
jgi:hypothetical protein